MVAVPEAVGVHWKTFSGAPPVCVAQPVSVLAPLVVPVKVPPAAGTTVAAAQAPPAIVVDVVLDVAVTLVLEVVRLVLDVVVTLVLDVAVTLVLEVVVTLVLDVVVTLVLDVVGTVVFVVLVVEALGGVTLKLNAPLEPPHDPPKPSTTIK